MKMSIKIILTVLGVIACIFILLIMATMFYFEPVENSTVSLQELSKVNDQIIAYFQSENIQYDNYSYNYVDEKNKVVVVGLLDNSKEEQDRFKELVVDSEYIRFEKGERLTDY